MNFEWSVVERPPGSIALPVEVFFDPAHPQNGGPPDDRSTPQAMFLIDSPGDYVLELRVIDEGGLAAPSEACPQPTGHRVHILALPPAGMVVQLTWDTPDDPDQTDMFGTDMDLHMLNWQSDAWFDSQWDCHSLNPVPDWGDIENPEDNPSLSTDDTNGAGPEIIHLGQPENTDPDGQGYQVGVYYYRGVVQSLGDGRSTLQSTATVRIFVEGDPSWQGIREFNEDDLFWVAADIGWFPENHRVTPVDREFEHP